MSDCDEFSEIRGRARWPGAIRGAVVILALAALFPIARFSNVRAEQGQVFKTPQGSVENLRFEQAAGGVINITYDLKSDDADAVFSILLEVSQDGGASFTVKPTSISGDVGSSVRPGSGKRIVWLASRDVESLQIDQFRFNIRASAGAARPVVLGRLTVNTTPPAAAVFVDGINRGVTPLTLTDLPVGRHDVRLAMAGFLENRRSIDVRADALETVAVDLTPTAPSGAATQIPPPTGAPPSGGGVNKFVWIGAAAGGAAAAGLALAGGGGSDPPPPASEICGNGVDDDADGQIDESPCPPPTEICGNGIDDDRDGLVDESPCPQPIACTFSISPTTVPQFASGGGQQQVGVTVGPSGCSPSTWTASPSGASWISLSTNSGTGSGSVTLTAAANTGTVSRSGSVTIAGQSAAVSQSGATSPTEPPCSFRAAFEGGGTSTSVPGDSTGARRTITVETSSSCQWSVSGTPSWFGVVQGNSTQTGSGSVVMATFEVNPTGRERQAGFSVAGIGFSVVQCAARC